MHAILLIVYFIFTRTHEENFVCEPYGAECRNQIKTQDDSRRNDEMKEVKVCLLPQEQAEETLFQMVRAEKLFDEGEEKQ